MLVDLDHNGTLIVRYETPAEKFALHAWSNNHEVMCLRRRPEGMQTPLPGGGFLLLPAAPDDRTPA